MTTDHKFCVNCRHHYHNAGSSPSIPSGHRCTSNDLVGWDLVTGDRTFPLCRSMREMDSMCGPNARKYEAKIIMPKPYAR